MRPFEEKERAYEEAIAPQYDAAYHASPIAIAHDEDFAAFVASRSSPGDRVLDLGCGPGSLWPSWKKRLPDRALIGVDLSPRMISMAREAFPGDDFRVGSAFEIPLESGSVDLVIASSIFHHIPDADLPSALKEVHRILDEHGQLVGREPLRRDRLGDQGGWLSGAIMTFRHLVFRLTRTREHSEPDPGPHHHAYDFRELVRLLGNVFGVKAVEFRHPLSSYVFRCADRNVADLALFVDEHIGHFGGNEIYYVCDKSYADAQDVISCIERDIAERNEAAQVEFLATLRAVTEIIAARFTR